MAKKRKSSAKVCMPGACPGGFKHLISVVAYVALVYYVLMLLGVGGKLWWSTLIIVVLSYLAVKWCPGQNGDCCP